MEEYDHEYGDHDRIGEEYCGSYSGVHEQEGDVECSRRHGEYCSEACQSDEVSAFYGERYLFDDHEDGEHGHCECVSVEEH